MYYYGARYYDPRISIWYSTDPLAEKYSSVSPFVYCLQNPVRFIDPDGKDPGDVVAGFIAAIADYSLQVTNFREWSVTSDIGDYNRGLYLADIFTKSLGEALMIKGAVDIGIAGGVSAAGLATLIIPGIGEITCPVAQAAALTLAIEGLVEGAAGAFLYNQASGNIEKGNYAKESQNKSKDGNNKPTKTERQQAKKEKKNSSESEYGKVNPHKKQSNGNRKEKHQKGEATNQRNQGGEKGDIKRNRYQDSKKRKE